MSSHAIALAAQFASLPGVEETARALGEPSTLAVIGISLGGIILGRFLAMGHSGGAQD